MANPIRRLLDQCNIGFTASQKTMACVGLVIYFVSPFDLLPDVLPPFTYADDLYALWLVVKILGAPTLRGGGPSGGACAYAPGQVVRVNCRVVPHREEV